MEERNSPLTISTGYPADNASAKWPPIVVALRFLCLAMSSFKKNWFQYILLKFLLISCMIDKLVGDITINNTWQTY